MIEGEKMIYFTKMHGLGNDYVYMDYEKEKEKMKDCSTFAKWVSNRHFGIGSDGLILICSSKVADFRMRMFNADGSEAEMCGNGIRCVGKFVYDKKMTSQTHITVETLAGIIALQLQVEQNVVKQVTVTMGKPILEADKVPVIAENSPVANISLQAMDKKFLLTCVSMGNPHAVTVVKDVDNFPVQVYGPILEKDPHFPKKANIEFVEIINDHHIKMRVWERGSGETLACGTGACATVVAQTLQKAIPAGEEITVSLLGGDLKVKYDQQVFMTGPAVTVFEGQIEEEEIPW